MTEIHFIVEEAPEGGFTARAVGADIFTEADDLPALHEQVRDAVRCHFDEGKSLVLLDGHGRFKARLEAPVSGNVLLRQSQHHRLANAEFCVAVAKSRVVGKPGSR